MKKYHLSDAYALRTSITEDGQERALHGEGSFPCASYIDHYGSGREAYPWHWHDEMEIAYVTQGQVIACINDRQFLLEQGEGLFINPRVLHAFSLGESRTATMPNLLFRPALLYGSRESVFWEKYVKPLALSPAFSHLLLRRSSPWQADILDRAEAAFSLMTAEAYGYELRTRAALCEIILSMGENAQELRDIGAGDQPEVDRVRQMLSFIQLHYTEPICVQQIADSAFISRRECMRSFRRVIGTSPLQYVLDMRLRRAKQLLLETDWPVLDIGVCCGFQNQSYFTKLFRERTGVSPGKFRKQEAGERILDVRC